MNQLVASSKVQTCCHQLLQEEYVENGRDIDIMFGTGELKGGGFSHFL